MSESDTGAGEPARPLPLDGVVVLDLGQIYQGPYAGLLLAYSGARVIKVEHPRGEALRGHSHQLPFAMLNSSKEIVSLDLKSPRGRELFIQLADGADAVLCNFAPGVPERLGNRRRDALADEPQAGLCPGQRLRPRRPGRSADCHGRHRSGAHGRDEHQRIR